MGQIIAQHPAAAVDEDENRQPFPAGSRRPHKIQVQGAPLALDGPFGLFDARQIDRNGRLQIGQHAARVGHGQRLDGGSAAVQHVQIGLGSLRQPLLRHGVAVAVDFGPVAAGEIRNGDGALLCSSEAAVSAPMQDHSAAS